jgi:hypothetical protein
MSLWYILFISGLLLDAISNSEYVAPNYGTIEE